MTLTVRKCAFCEGPAVIGSPSTTCSAAWCKEREIRELRAELAEVTRSRDALAQGVTVRIPTEAMEQEIQARIRRAVRGS